VVKAEAVDPFASLPKAHDPRLGRLGLKTQFSPQRPQRREVPSWE
jgi:hypothetical protein